MVETLAESVNYWPRRATYVPHVLEQWALENGLTQHRWLEIFPSEDLTDRDVYRFFGHTLRFVAQGEGFRFFAGVSSQGATPTCYWLGVPV